MTSTASMPLLPHLTLSDLSDQLAKRMQRALHSAQVFLALSVWCGMDCESRLLTYHHLSQTLNHNISL
jgi:hypothetical protein